MADNFISYLDNYLKEWFAFEYSLTLSKKGGQAYTIIINVNKKPKYIAKFYDFLKSSGINLSILNDYDDCITINDFLLRIESEPSLQYNLEDIISIINIDLRSFKRYIDVCSNPKIDCFPKVIRYENEIVLNDTIYGLIIEDFIEGHDLNSLDNTKYSTNDIIEFLDQMSDNVVKLYENGIVHRDISPDNIIFSNGRYILIDPGFVKIDDGNVTKASRLIFGKYNYASPEQAIGYAKNCDFTSDIYSIGIIGLEMAIGYNPIMYITNNYKGTVNIYNYLLNIFDRKIEDDLMERLGDCPKNYQLLNLLKKMLQVDKKFRFESPQAFKIHVKAITQTEIKE